jgi:hypothetical protein
VSGTLIWLCPYYDRAHCQSRFESSSQSFLVPLRFSNFITFILFYDTRLDVAYQIGTFVNPSFQSTHSLPKTNQSITPSLTLYKTAKMMFTKSTTLLFAAMQASLAVAGNAILSNRCSYDIWVWSVSQTTGSSSAIHVPARSQHIEAMQPNSPTSLKVSKTEQLLNGQHTQFEYSIVNNQLWYDISFVNCASDNSASNCPGHKEGLSMSSPNKACAPMKCAAGAYCPTQAYYCAQPMLTLGIQEPVFTCPGAGASMDLNMNMCADAAPLKRSIAGRMLVDA